MTSDLLESLGLGKLESRVYLALIDLGQSTTGAIVEKSGVPSSKLYAVLRKLMDLGLVSYSLQRRTKHFRAAHPQKLSELLIIQKREVAEHEHLLTNLIPQLKLKQELAEKSSTQDTFLQVFEGTEGIKTARELVLDTLRKGDEFLVLGSPRVILNERLRGYFNEFHQRRAKKGIRYRAIYNLDAKAHGQDRKTYPLTQIRYLNGATPSVLWIFKDSIAHVVLTKEPITMVIKNEQIARSVLTYFDMIWSQCKD